MGSKPFVYGLIVCGLKKIGVRIRQNLWPLKDHFISNLILFQLK